MGFWSTGARYQTLLDLPVNPFGLRPRSRRGRSVTSAGPVALLVQQKQQLQWQWQWWCCQQWQRQQWRGGGSGTGGSVLCLTPPAQRSALRLSSFAETDCLGLVARTGLRWQPAVPAWQL